MGKQDKIHMPSSQGGLVLYFEDYKSKLEISPQTVIIACAAIIILVTLLHQFYPV